MGTWGNKSFENDWAADLKGNVMDGNLELIEQALEKIINTPTLTKPDSVDCEEAVAACEFVAIANNILSNNTEEETVTFVKANLVPLWKVRMDGVKQKAVLVLNRITADSELKDLWQESEEYQTWIDNISDLVSRLS